MIFVNGSVFHIVHLATRWLPMLKGQPEASGVSPWFAKKKQYFSQKECLNLKPHLQMFVLRRKLSTVSHKVKDKVPWDRIQIYFVFWGVSHPEESTLWVLSDNCMGFSH